MGKKKQWKNFEESTHKTSTKIFPDKQVLANQEVMGSIGGSLRQVDVKVGDVDFIDIECKDHKRSVDQPVVEQFAGKLRDEGAKKGIIVSNSDFTKPALKAAAFYGIEPVVLVDKGYDETSNFIIKAPVLARAVYIDSLQYGIAKRTIGPAPVISSTVYEMNLGDGSGRTLYDFFKQAWNSGDYKINSVGNYQLQFDKVPIIDLQGNIYTVDTLTYHYHVNDEGRKGEMGVTKARGLYNVNNQTFTTAEEVLFEPFRTAQIEEWEMLEPNAYDDLKNHSMLEIVGLVPMPDTPPHSVD